jgi:hypothetical protein
MYSLTFFQLRTVKRMRAYALIQFTILHKQQEPIYIELNISSSKHIIHNVQGMHPLVLTYTLLFLSVWTQQISKYHSHFTVYNEVIELNSITVCYMFRLIKPSSGSIHWQLFSNYWMAFYMNLYITI